MANYDVLYTFTNHESKTAKLEIGTDHELVYMLYSEKSAVKRNGDYVQMYNPDYVTPPPVEIHRVKPGQTFQWKGVAQVFLDDGVEPRLKPGVYYLLPFASGMVLGRKESEEYDIDRLVTLTIPKSPEEMEFCSGVSKKDRKLMTENNVPLGTH